MGRGHRRTQQPKVKKFFCFFFVHKKKSSFFPYIPRRPNIFSSSARDKFQKCRPAVAAGGGARGGFHLAQQRAHLLAPSAAARRGWSGGRRAGPARHPAALPARAGASISANSSARSRSSPAASGFFSAAGTARTSMAPGPKASISSPSLRQRFGLRQQPRGLGGRQDPPPPAPAAAGADRPGGEFGAQPLLGQALMGGVLVDDHQRAVGAPPPAHRCRESAPTGAPSGWSAGSASGGDDGRGRRAAPARPAPPRRSRARPGLALAELQASGADWQTGSWLAGAAARLGRRRGAGERDRPVQQRGRWRRSPGCARHWHRRSATPSWPDARSHPAPPPAASSRSAATGWRPAAMTSR